MDITIIKDTLERRNPSWERTLASGVTRAALEQVAWEAGWRGVRGITAYTIDELTYEVTVLKFTNLSALQEDMGLPVLAAQ